MELSSKILSHCHVNTNEEGDRFVGIKADTDEIKVYFPIGYQLPDKELDIKKDIIHLFQVLAELSDSSESLIAINKFDSQKNVKFPINAYLEVINYYLDKNGYYIETEPVFKKKDRGNIDWGKTIKRQKPLIQSNFSPVYTQYIVRESTFNENNLITHINRYCVYESFSKLGWIFTTYMPEPPLIPFDIKRFIIVINDKLATTNNDKDKMLFKAMKDMLEYMDNKNLDEKFYYGTYYFERVWERLIERVFGIKNKKDYFPRTRWNLKQGKNKEKYPLEPDSIMINNGKVYVLDAKYYKYGITGNPNHLPDSSSINKQITYAEYIHKKCNLENEFLYNAFIMPYNANNNKFDLNAPYGNIGEAVGEWKSNNLYYERIQGIVIDTRYLMYNYIGNSRKNIIKLSASIESAIIENNEVVNQTYNMS